MWISSRFFVICLLLRFGRCNSQLSSFPFSLSPSLSIPLFLQLSLKPCCRPCLALDWHAPQSMLRFLCVCVWVCALVCVCFGIPINSCRHISFYAALCLPKNLLCQKGAKAHKDFWGFNGFSPPQRETGKNFFDIAYIKFAKHKANFCFTMSLTSNICYSSWL